MDWDFGGGGWWERDGHILNPLRGPGGGGVSKSGLFGFLEWYVWTSEADRETEEGGDNKHSQLGLLGAERDQFDFREIIRIKLFFSFFRKLINSLIRVQSKCIRDSLVIY